jgi:hypothetical protein
MESGGNIGNSSNMIISRGPLASDPELWISSNLAANY